jgi:hypothetical protein
LGRPSQLFFFRVKVRKEAEYNKNSKVGSVAEGKAFAEEDQQSSSITSVSIEL